MELLTLPEPDELAQGAFDRERFVRCGNTTSRLAQTIFRLEVPPNPMPRVYPLRTRALLFLDQEPASDLPPPMESSPEPIRVSSIEAPEVGKISATVEVRG